MRLATFLVAACVVLIAVSAGAAAYFVFGFTRAEAVTVAVAALTALALYNAVSARMGVRSVASNQLRDLSRANADVARELAELERGLMALRQRADGAIDKTRAATDPLAAEIAELGTLVRRLAETVAVHEAKLAALAPAPQASAPERPVAPARAAAAAPQADPAAAPAPPADGPNPLLAVIDAAVKANRVDLYLQPIVTLPQRKVRYYEVTARLRTETGEPVPATDFAPVAEAGGLMPSIDNLVVNRSVQVVRRLLLKNRDIGLFCNLSGATLADRAAFPRLLEFLDANRAIAPSLALGLSQSALRAAGPIENESLAALAERGFHFALDRVTDLRFDPPELAARGFRFVKVAADLLLHRARPASSNIRPADLSDQLSRAGIALIAERIDSEGPVVGLLDCDVRYGQGLLFSPPRPLRAEALQGVAERADVAARAARTPDLAQLARRV
jgi:cyclic-di-GMP phosphodiesterase TipF (flagellum assembly factor)